MVQQKTIWILTLVHIGLLYGQLNLGWQCGSLWIGEDNATASAMALVVFFSVFYSGNCFTRQNAFYATCMGMAGTCVNYAGLVRVHFPNADGKTMWNACRHVTAHDRHSCPPLHPPHLAPSRHGWSHPCRAHAASLVAGRERTHVARVDLTGQVRSCFCVCALL